MRACPTTEMAGFEVIRAGAILAVSDFERSLAFYRDTLGLEVEALYGWFDLRAHVDEEDLIFLTRLPSSEPIPRVEAP